MSTVTDANTDAKTSYQTTYTIEEIHELLPHRHPFALVDRVIDFIPGEKVVGVKNVTYNEPYFPGHIPGKPLMPGVLIIESMAQVGGVLLTLLPGMKGKFFAFAGIDKARFRRPVIPGDRLMMTVELLAFKRERIAKMQGQAVVDGELVAEAEMMFSRLD